MKNAKFTGRDDNHQDETTNYWFEIDGETYAVSESCGEQTILDSDECPVEAGNCNVELFSALKSALTDEIRQDY